jgi:hypothetical protein
VFPRKRPDKGRPAGSVVGLLEGSSDLQSDVIRSC